MKRPTPGQTEQRDAPTDAVVVMDGPRLRGLVPYGVESRDFGGWREVMEPGCLDGADLSDCVATVDHAGIPLGRVPDTLSVERGTEGLRWSVELPESRSDVRDAVERKVLKAGSWRMVVARDRWEGNVRHVLEVAKLLDLSVVTRPAYDAAVAEYRSEQDPEVHDKDTTEDEMKRKRTDEGQGATGGGLQVEDRANTHEDRTAEARVLEAMAGVPAGEARDLTHAEASPVEPDDLRTVLIDRFREASVVAASGVPIIQTDRKAVKFPVLTGDVDVAFYDELEEITLSDPELDEFEVPVKALKALVRMSSEAAEDSDPDLIQLLSENLNTAMSLKGDRELVAGNDPKGFPGLLNVAGTQSIAVDGALSWDEVIRAVGLLVEANVPGPYAVLMGARPATVLDLQKETTTSAKYVGRPDGVPPVFLSGWLPVTAGADPTTTALVYAPAQQQIVLRRAVTVEIDRSQEFSSDAILARGRYRLGLGVPHPQSIVKLTGVDAPAIA